MKNYDLLIWQPQKSRDTVARMKRVLNELYPEKSKYEL